MAWIIGQFRKAAPFAVAGATELALVNLPVLLVSAFVSDRVAVAQWALPGSPQDCCGRSVFRQLPLAAELGHDYAVGLKDQLRSLYAADGLCHLLASVAVSDFAILAGFLPLWTRGACLRFIADITC